MAATAALAAAGLAAVLATATAAQTADDPIKAEIDLRDQLIFDQEALLNTYRCLFEIDTHVVPGGCPSSTPVEFQELAVSTGGCS